MLHTPFRRIVSALFLLIFSASVVAPSASATESSPTTTRATTTATSATTDKSTKPAPKRFYRKFIVTYEPTKIESMQSVRTEMMQEKYVDDILDAMAQEIRLPRNIPVTFKDCGSANAFWSPNDKSVTYCYDLIDLYNRAYTEVKGEESAFLTGATKRSVLVGTTIFILLHELGHGLTDMYNLPVTGREEDAVDQFATTLLISADDADMPLIERPSRFALLGAYFFKMLAENPSDLTRETLADEHALGQQRYYDVMCLVLGSNTKAYQSIVTKGVDQVEQEYIKNPKMTPEDLQKRLRETDALNILPQARATRCEAEYKKYSKSWDYMMNHIIKAPYKSPQVLLHS